MPPVGGPKRKRSERTISQDEISRPSPHQPDHLDLAKHSQQQSPIRNGRENTASIAAETSRTGQASINQSNATRGQGTVTTTISHEPDTDMVDDQDDASNEPRTYLYTYLTDDITSDWADGGNDQVKEKISQLVRNQEHAELDILVQELVEAGTTDKLDPEDVGTLLKDVMSEEINEDISSTIADEIESALLGAISITFAEDIPNPNIEKLSELIIATNLDPETLRIELDGKLLEQLGLIRPTFYRVGIRKQTNVLYRQANFNLMREESEGFAKLMTELFNTSASDMHSGDVAENTIEKVKAMIGAFDLDVGRSLDVILDVFGSVLVRQYRFFVKLLRVSPWWPRQEKSGDNDTAVSSIVGGLPAWALPSTKSWYLNEFQKERLTKAIHRRDEDFWDRAATDGIRAFFGLGYVSIPPEERETVASVEQEEFEAQWIRETGTIPPTGNRDAAQLLGFKLRFYSTSPARDSGEDLPKNLIYLSALLIKIGFISLLDLYPHIWRSDEEMEELKQQRQKEKNERERMGRPGAGAKNALLMAGALADDTLPIPSRLRESNTRASTPAKDAEPEKQTAESNSEIPDQKVLLLQSLLAIGALPEALFILGRFPWMVNLIPDMAEYINRILQHSISQLYNQLRPMQDRTSLNHERPAYETDLPGLQKGSVILTEPVIRKVLRWPQLDKDDFETDGISYRFYWDEWSDNVPMCQSVDDFFILCRTLLPLVGARIGQDPALVLRIARIGKKSLTEDPSENNRRRWLDLSKRVLLPSVSLTKANPGLVNEVYELISMFSTNSRYMMYLEWLNGRVSRSPDMKTAFDQAKAETRDILKRISKTNVRPMARALAKIAYANPHIVITTALTQIEVYDSIADVFVEGARYFTDLGYDVLTWALISSMARAGRSRVQEGGIFTSKWLTALSHFAGKIYKRYNLMKPGPVLQYVADRLDKGSAADLVMLEQIVVSMAGIAPDTNFNDAQLQAMGGGSLLQAQTILQLLDQRHTSKQSSKRLVKALQDDNLTAKLLLSMAQQRQACIFTEGEVPLKAIGNVFDEINRVFGQYLDLLRANLSLEEFQRAIPDTAALLTQYDITPEIAFWIGRPVISKLIAEFEKPADEESTDLLSKDINGDVEMADQDGSEEDGETVESEEVTTAAATPTDNDLIVDVETSNAEADDISIEENWHPVLKNIMDHIADHVPLEIVDVIGVGFYVTFWQLSLYDIIVPGKSYEDEMSRQKRRIASVTSDRSNVSVSATRARETQIKQLQQVIDDLLEENKQHLKAFSESRSRLQKEKEQWFANKGRISSELNMALMEHCFLPRILVSPTDAYFCFKFAKLLHSTGTPNFRTLGFYDQLFKPERLASLIFTCTSKESDNLGRFLNEVLRDLGRWQEKKSTYEREAFGLRKNLPGFAMKLENGKPQIFLDFESFRRILYKWHSQISSALLKCLSSTEYMHVRNAISILRSITTVYPAVDFHGKSLQKAVGQLRESDKEDLKVSSQALLGALHRREKQWIQPKAFRQGQEAVTTEEVTDEPQTTIQKPDSDRMEEDGETDEVKTAIVKKQDSADMAKDQISSRPLSSEQRSSSRGPVTKSSTPIRPSSDVAATDRRPARSSDAKGHTLPRRLSPPPSRYQQSPSLPTRPEAEYRNGYRDTRPPPPRTSVEAPRPDSRSGYPRAAPLERIHDPAYDSPHRYSRPDRPSMLDRDERPPRREHDSRPVHDERKASGRDLRNERDIRQDRDIPRLGEREQQRSDREDTRHRSDFPQRVHDGPQRERRPPENNINRASTSQSTTPAVNPERAAIINADDSRPGVSIRGQAQDKPRSSRPSSPRRGEERRQSSRPEREDRSEHRSDSASRQPSGNPPSSDIARNVPPMVGPNRDNRGHGRSQVDMQHGRLEQDPSHRAPSRTDRTSEAEPPSGPRNRPGSTNLRNVQGPSPSSTRPQVQSNDRPTPSGPGRQSRPSNIQDSSAPSQPQIDTSGVHPDRMNQISPTEPSRPIRGPPVQNPPPAGPRVNHAPLSAPSGPATSPRGPPSGPQAEAGRGRRHPMATVNNTLVQAAQGPAGRGRGGMRQNSTSFPSHTPTPGPVSQGNYSSPQEAAAANPNGLPIQPRTQTRQDGGRDDDRRPQRPRGDDRDLQRMEKDDRKGDETRRNIRRDDGQRPHRSGPPDDNGPRKHPREDGSSFNGPPRGNSRMGGDGKRPRRGG